MIPSQDAPLYTALVTNVGGTHGHVEIENGPTIRTGGPFDQVREPGTNPEQFLAAAWSTCLGATLRTILKEDGLRVESRVRVEVDLRREPGGEYFFVPRAFISIDTLPEAAVAGFASRAHSRCPVSKLLRGAHDPDVVVEAFARMPTAE